ncbi:alcohol dehydrogenase catalytic domain-containing protein [Propionibacterium freudenreichii]|uniref:alcohol dehydrogenase catalytic domain-containing protein n=1 Tax=Propionibacterium freudenreichii TaxID=1744 RepID=UPI0005437BA1|nr:hypothetical protein [Propionibacterium sp.]CEG92189.1 Putative uncharacterized protein [Propionibacterium freudenreichii]
MDTKVRSGGKPSDGKVLGWDAAGVVQGVGPEVTLFAPGDEVFYAGDLTRAGFRCGVAARRRAYRGA